MYLQTLKTRKRVFGEEHPAALLSMCNLGLLYNSIGRNDDARTLCATSLPLTRRVLGTRHRWTSLALRGLAVSYENLGRRDDALALHGELLELKLAAADNPDATPGTLNNWVAAVNHGREHGWWAFHFCRDPQVIEKEPRRLHKNAASSAVALT